MMQGRRSSDTGFVRSFIQCRVFEFERRYMNSMLAASFQSPFRPLAADDQSAAPELLQTLHLMPSAVNLTRSIATKFDLSCPSR